MSGCCSSANENPCSIPRSEPEVCPSCGKKGKSVPVLTVKSLVRDHTRVLASVTYSFCRTADCQVVYFSNQATFTKPDLKVRVGIKETADPIPLCYCFDYSRDDICREIKATGETSVLEEIKTEVQGGFCACEVKNPSGTCCLGDIARAIQEAKKRAVETLQASH